MERVPSALLQPKCAVIQGHCWVAGWRNWAIASLPLVPVKDINPGPTPGPTSGPLGSGSLPSVHHPAPLPLHVHLPRLASRRAEHFQRPRKGGAGAGPLKKALESSPRSMDLHDPSPVLDLLLWTPKPAHDIVDAVGPASRRGSSLRRLCHRRGGIHVRREHLANHESCPYSRLNLACRTAVRSAFASSATVTRTAVSASTAGFLWSSPPPRPSLPARGRLSSRRLRWPRCPFGWGPTKSKSSSRRAEWGRSMPRRIHRAVARWR